VAIKKRKKGDPGSLSQIHALEKNGLPENTGKIVLGLANRRGGVERRRKKGKRCMESQLWRTRAGMRKGEEIQPSACVTQRIGESRKGWGPQPIESAAEGSCAPQFSQGGRSALFPGFSAKMGNAAHTRNRQRRKKKEGLCVIGSD